MTDVAGVCRWKIKRKHMYQAGASVSVSDIDEF